MSVATTFNATRRVQALAELCHRYAAIINGLASTIEEVLDDAEPELRDPLVAAIDDANAQIAAAADAFRRAVADLPEGRLV